MQEDWDDEKEPDGFTLSGAVPEKENLIANGEAAGRLLHILISRLFR